jgi:hypothetical protein
MDDRFTSKFAETIYVVEATHFERLCLWQEWNCFVKWQEESLVSSNIVGKLARMQVNVDVSWAIINGQRVAFYETTSQVVDHRLVSKWLPKVFPVLRHYEPGRQPLCNAMNFGTYMHLIFPMKDRSRRIQDAMMQRYVDSLHSFLE